MCIWTRPLPGCHLFIIIFFNGLLYVFTLQLYIASVASYWFLNAIVYGSVFYIFLLR